MITFKIHVKQSVGEGEVETCCEDDEFEEEHAKGASEGDGCHLLKAFLFELDGCEYVGVVGNFAEGSRAAGEKNWTVGFREVE